LWDLFWLVHRHHDAYRAIKSGTQSWSIAGHDIFIRGAGDFQGGIAAYQHAVAIDPNFAAGYSLIGGAYANFGQETAKPYLQRAFDCSAI
jgi:hypothetical protein